MEKYTDFDYLCDEPFTVDGIGVLRSPTLRQIRKATYNLFNWYIKFLLMTKEEYLTTFNLLEQYQALTEEEKESFTLYKLIISDKYNINILIGIISLFVANEFEFNSETQCFDTYTKIKNIDRDTEKLAIGHIGDDNFELFRQQVRRILGIKDTVEKPVKFKNKLAEKMYQKIQEHTAKTKKKQDETMEMDNMIRKYCTHNKVGINILNVWNMTYYQFIAMFSEYCNGRNYDYNDMVAANTFSYKKASDYRPMDYMRRI